MPESDVAPLPRRGDVFFDVRGNTRTMRLSWYAETGVAVFSIWQGSTCTGTFRVPIADLPRLVDALQRGPAGAAAARGRAPGTGRGQPNGGSPEPTGYGALAAAGGYPDPATASGYGDSAQHAVRTGSVSPAPPGGPGGYPDPGQASGTAGPVGGCYPEVRDPGQPASAASGGGHLRRGRHSGDPGPREVASPFGGRHEPVPARTGRARPDYPGAGGTSGYPDPGGAGRGPGLAGYGYPYTGEQSLLAPGAGRGSTAGPAAGHADRHSDPAGVGGYRGTGERGRHAGGPSREGLPPDHQTGGGHRAPGDVPVQAGLSLRGDCPVPGAQAVPREPGGYHGYPDPGQYGHHPGPGGPPAGTVPAASRAGSPRTGTPAGGIMAGTASDRARAQLDPGPAAAGVAGPGSGGGESWSSGYASGEFPRRDPHPHDDVPVGGERSRDTQPGDGEHAAPGQRRAGKVVPRTLPYGYPPATDY